MPLCKGIITNTGSLRCSRPATHGFPFCWQHGRGVQKIITDMDSGGPDDPSFLLQHLTYRRESFDEHVCNTFPAKTPLSALRPFDGNHGGVSMGALEALPLEVLWAIFSYLTIPALESLKRTNSRASLILSTSPQYKSIMTYAPQLVKALYETRLHQCFPIGRVHNAFTQARCIGCGSFAAYIFLPGLQRCCQRCVYYDPEFMPLTCGIQYRDDDISLASMTKLPAMWTTSEECLKVSGHFGTIKGKMALISKAEARVSVVGAFFSLCSLVVRPRSAFETSLFSGHHSTSYETFDCFIIRLSIEC